MEKIIARYSLGMTMSPKTDLASFSQGMGFLARRPLATLGMAVLGTALAALAPFLQIKFNLPNDDLTASALVFAALFPLEMYFIPRFLAEADAFAGGGPQNPLVDWERHFDERWMKAMGGKFLLSAAVGLGFLCLFLPGMVILFAFGWAPWRILLRGESLKDAGRNSLRLMALAWRRVLGAALVLVAINVGMLIILSWIMGSLEQHPGPWEQLTRPRAWVVNFISVLLNLWTSACLLALYRNMEEAFGDVLKEPAQRN